MSGEPTITRRGAEFHLPTRVDYPEPGRTANEICAPPFFQAFWITGVPALRARALLRRHRGSRVGRSVPERRAGQAAGGGSDPAGSRRGAFRRVFARRTRSPTERGGGEDDRGSLMVDGKGRAPLRRRRLSPQARTGKVAITLRVMIPFKPLTRRVRTTIKASGAQRPQAPTSEPRCICQEAGL